jgi:hypothetical protein
VEPVLAWLEGSSLGHAIRSAGLWTYAILNLTHVLGISSLFGSILTLDLRLLGIWRSVPVDAVARPVIPIACIGFLLAAVSGICMLATNGTEYVGNPFLAVKFAAIGAGVINVGVVTQLPAWRSRTGGSLPIAGERQLAIAGAVSLVCWLTAITAGRMIGYW